MTPNLVQRPRSTAPTLFHRELRVSYPPGNGRVVLRAELDRERASSP
jgi:hypothetical protein